MKTPTKLHVRLTVDTIAGCSDSIIPAGTEALVETYRKNAITGVVNYLISYHLDRKDQFASIPASHTCILGRK